MSDDVDYRILYERTAAEFRNFIDVVPLSVFRANTSKELLQANKRFTRLFGLRAGASVPHELFEHFGEAMRRRIEAQLEGEIEHVDDYIEVPVNIDDRERHVRVHLIVTEGQNGPEILGYCQDATNEVERREMLQAEARTDPLSGLPNRKGLEEFFASIEGERVAVILCDADGFKGVNDTLGHDAGDLVITTFSDRLRRAMRPTDLVARIGGDEFVIVAPCVPSPHIAERIAERCHPLFREPIDFEGNEIRLSATMGLVHGAPGDSPDELLRKADEALYEAKEAGRDRIGVYTRELSRKSMTPLVLQAELGKALTAGELHLEVQPIFASDGTSLDLEALLRWNHPSLGAIGPDQAIPAAEKTGLIRPLGRWVIRAAADLLVLLGSRHSVSINMSVSQISDPDLPAALQATLAENALAPSQLRFELTEPHLVEETEGALEIVQALAAGGTPIIADGFGAGTTTVADLIGLPLSGVKLDSVLLERAGTATGKRVLRSVVAGMHDAGVEVIAKDVENAERLASALDAGVTLMQGMHLAGPSTIDQLPDRLRSGASRLRGPLAA